MSSMPTSDTWYPVTDQHPPTGIIVHVAWDARKFHALRAVEKGRVYWKTLHRGEYVRWPTPADKNRLSPEPQSWQPLFPERWLGTLPEPHPPLYPVLQSPMLEPVCADPSGQWWLDRERVTYSEAGDISRTEAEGRVMRMIAGMRVGRETIGVPTRTAGEVIADFGAAAIYTEADPTSDYQVKLQMDARDHQDATLAGVWFAALNPPEMRPRSAAPWTFSRLQRVLIRRSWIPPDSFALIGREMGISRQRAKQLYAEAIDAVHRVANGGPAFLHVTGKDHLAELQERNRAARLACGQLS